jgi:hypothetical protein
MNGKKEGKRGNMVRTLTVPSLRYQDIISDLRQPRILMPGDLTADGKKDQNGCTGY